MAWRCVNSKLIYCILTEDLHFKDDDTRIVFHLRKFESWKQAHWKFAALHVAACNQVFHKLYENANLASEALLRENKKCGDKMLPLVEIEPRPLITSDSKSNTLLSELVRHVLLRGSLNFCSCTTWFLDLDDLVRINRIWLYKEPKVSVLQANAMLVQKNTEKLNRVP